ncbi:acyltransferase [Croceibacterium atlanticum]|nr:DapH/DapD/GlmU-related protein [Croceibacterium atlanticum]
MRLRLLRAAGATIDPGAFVEAGISVVAGRISIGARSYINRQCLLDARGGIEIGENTLVGPRVSFLTATHPVMPDTPRAGPVVYESITVGSNAWIGAAATLLPGCEVGDGCVVAAGSIVRGKLAPNTLHAGVPAVCKRSLAPLTPQLAQAG